ncbi:MAG: DUF423 domain-containing protein [Steroidobacteraceae bacterium]|nr:DUF423 domain-containing protein [Steroidobacteraceae bacterium]
MQPDRDSAQAFARGCIVAGSVLMFGGLVLGALGTHLVADRVSSHDLASYETAVLYQLLHALGLVLLGVLGWSTSVTAQLRWSARLMALGMALFSGSIYLATAGAPRMVLEVAPAGGTALMLSWLLLAWHAGTRIRN